MTTNDTKQNLTEEAMPVDAAELDEEMLEDLSGGAIGPFRIDSSQHARRD